MGKGGIFKGDIRWHQIQKYAAEGDNFILNPFKDSESLDEKLYGWSKIKRLTT